MAWQTTLVTNLRYYLNPNDTTTFTDEQLQRFIVMAAGEVFQRLGTTDYVADYAALSITPDPTTDAGLSAIITVRAAYIVIRSQLHQYSFTAGFSITDDRSKFDGKEMLASLKDLLKYYDEMFEEGVNGYLSGDSSNVYSAILTPYTRGQ